MQTLSLGMRMRWSIAFFMCLVKGQGVDGPCCFQTTVWPISLRATWEEKSRMIMSLRSKQSLRT